MINQAIDLPGCHGQSNNDNQITTHSDEEDVNEENNDKNIVTN